MKKETVTGIYLKMESLLQLLIMSDSDQRRGGIDKGVQCLFLFYLFRQTSYQGWKSGIEPSADTDKLRDNAFYSFYLFAGFFALFLYIRLLKLRQTRIGK